jgi:AcrR family transcriptional regulator
VATTEALVEGRRARKKRETHESLVRAAHSLFLERGYEETTVDDIVEAADVSRATFFNHFPGKSALLSELADAIDEQFERLIERERRREASTQERLLRLFAGFARLGSGSPQNRELVRRVLSEARFGGLSLDQRGAHMARFSGALVSLLRDGVAQGDVRTDYDISVLADVVAGTYLAVLLDWLGDPRFPLAPRLRAAAALLGEVVAGGRARTTTR